MKLAKLICLLSITLIASSLYAQDDMYPKSKPKNVPGYEYPDNQSRLVGYIDINDTYKVLSESDEFFEVQTDKFRAYMSKAEYYEAKNLKIVTTPVDTPATEQEFKTEILNQQDIPATTIDKDKFRQIGNIKLSKFIIGAIMVATFIPDLEVDPEVQNVILIAGSVSLVVLEISEMNKFFDLAK